MIVRVRFKLEGGHYHCRVFSSPAENQTFANCGRLVFSEREWEDVRYKFLMGGIQVIAEEDVA